MKKQNFIIALIIFNHQITYSINSSLSADPVS